MTVLKGQFFRIKVGGKVVAMSKSCSINKTANLESSTTKDSTGFATENECTSTSWSGSANGVVSLDNDPTGLNGFSLLNDVGDTITIEFFQSYGAKNREAEPDGKALHGRAIINDVQLEFPDRADSTYSVQFTGTGELEDGPAPSA